ncbi:hypothetical protein ANOM_002106 [Aspergillus nomiae NRRL 13137]|uniref:ER-bound oxygenase mpaB/mpaB'/Rubber oxygenase catalytic domain-containing protein n=1 Tax=Aspergillus nomiae NRRL (strain ATCC 15546 / NRRL 13137 / CBS 260.88 / M93) TaxID=1509407 RepID=A0A0L1JE94_ASPN3|nr:uncharacterized protein ANOM_002106 [Aspergillus nomiae NRRL 13137]KNG90124.1 hypothetical protein ANOM_002106 [Aspergillus nomiae NRRL 13137]
MSKTDGLINCQVIHSEIVTLIALQYANILVNSHPQIAQGVQNHSYFRTNPTSRIYYSLLYIQGVCGTPEERNCVSRIVNKAHRGVRGRNYNAMDPKQQLWVASCFFVATLTVQETFFGLLDEQLTEALYQDASRFGTSLQMPLEMWPESIHKFWEYWNHEIRHFEATPAVLSVARDVLYPHNLPLWILVASPILRIFTIHWLPEAYRARGSGEVRHLYEIAGTFPGCSGTRTLSDNIADLKAAVASNQKGTPPSSNNIAVMMANWSLAPKKFPDPQSIW